uniref:Uncharacterized protein n=1 Tax=Arundo donax TaxID=35708 RepID=A0A0A9FW03_ARUDO
MENAEGPSLESGHRAAALFLTFELLLRVSIKSERFFAPPTPKMRALWANCGGVGRIFVGAFCVSLPFFFLAHLTGTRRSNLSCFYFIRQFP